MLLAIDQGNSDTVFGLYDGEAWAGQWRTPTTGKSAPDYEALMRQWLLDHGTRSSQISRVVLSSVVPDHRNSLIQFASEYFNGDQQIVGPSIYNRLGLKLNSPHEIGSDLVANAIAAATIYPDVNCLVVDFGTALTVTCVHNTSILGVSIAPGLQTAVKSLFTHTAQLPEVPLELPDSVLGKNTIHAIQSGVLHGYIGLVRNLVDQAKKELGGDCRVLATGGLSSVLKPLTDDFDTVDPMLTLNGLKVIHEKLTG